MTRILAALSMLVLMIGAAWADMPAAVQKIHDQMLDATVKLNGNCSSEIIYSSRDQKTGDVETLILTAKHCVVEMKDTETAKVEKTIYDGRLQPIGMLTYYGDVIGKSFSSDVALVRLRDKQTYFANVIKLESASAPLYIGEDVATTTYPAAMAITVTKGLLGPMERAAIGDLPEHAYLRATPDIAPGSSGGGLYHFDGAGNYRLIGITTAGFRGFPFLSMFTPIDDIEAYLKVAAPEVYGTQPAKPGN